MTFVRRAAFLATLLALAVTPAVAATTAPARPATRPAATAPAPAKPKPAAPRPAAAPESDALDAVAAMVNDEAVLVSDVEEQLYLFLQQLQQQGGGMPDSAQVDTLRHRFLDEIIDERLLEAEAKRQGVTATDAEIERQVDAALAQAKERLGSEANFQEQLRRENLTEAALRARFRTDMRKQIVIEKIKQKMFPKHNTPQAEAEAYFAAHKDRFPKMPGEVRLQVIQISPEPDSAAVAAGLAKIQAIRKRIVAGEKFAKVAAETSEDPGSANSGGDLGYNIRGRMVKEFDDAAYSLKLNELSAPVRSPFGWHLIQVLDRDTVRTVAGRDSLGENGAPVLEAHVRHILVRVTPTDADVERAHDLAEHVREQAIKGTDFGTLVRRYSHYPGAVGPDGDVGFVSLGGMQPQIREGLDTLEVGQVSEVLPNQTGFNVFKLVDRHPERDYTLTEVKDQLPEFVGNLQRQDRYEDWVKTLRAKARIEYR